MDEDEDEKKEQLHQQRYIEDRKIADINSEISREVDAFERTVKQRYADRLKAHRDVIAEIDRQLCELARARRNAAVEENLQHPLVGKRVEELKGATFSRVAFRPTGVIGVVEVFRDGDEFPANMTCGVPQGGDLVIRVLKKDGTKSRKATKLFYRDRGYELPHTWRLIEDGKTTGK